MAERKKLIDRLKKAEAEAESELSEPPKAKESKPKEPKAPKQPKAKELKSEKSKSVDANPVSPTASDVPEITVAELDEKFIEMTRQEREEHVKKVVADAQRIGVEHSKLARLAGHQGLASDLLALAQIGNQIEKKLQTQRYWEKV